MSKVKVIIADEQTLFREGIGALLSNCDSIELIGEAANEQEIIEKVRELHPDVILMNMTIPVNSGSKVARQIRKENSDTRVLIVTEYEDRDHIITALKAGAHGYIPKRATASELVSAIQAIHTGGYFLYPSVARTVIDDYYRRTRRPGNLEPYVSVQDRSSWLDT